MSTQNETHQDGQQVRFNPTLLFLFLLLIAFSIRMYLPAVCPSQEFFLTALFAIGSGGLYALHCGNLGFQVLEKYKASGAVAVVLVIFVFMPASQLRDSEKCSGRSKKNTLLEILCCEKAFALNKANIAVAPVESVLRMKIVYPIGNSEKKDTATILKVQLSRMYSEANVTVYSYGSWRDAIFYSFKSFPNACTITYSGNMENEIRNNITNVISQVGSCTPTINNSLESFGPENVIVRIGE